MTKSFRQNSDLAKTTLVNTARTAGLARLLSCNVKSGAKFDSGAGDWHAYTTVTRQLAREAQTSSGTQGLAQSLVLGWKVLGAIEEIPRLTLGFYSWIFLAPKKLGHWRPVIDLRALNRFLRSPHFWMETSTSIMCSLQPGHWVTSLDFKDAFLHIPVAPAH